MVGIAMIGAMCVNFCYAVESAVTPCAKNADGSCVSENLACQWDVVNGTSTAIRWCMTGTWTFNCGCYTLLEAGAGNGGG